MQTVDDVWEAALVLAGLPSDDGYVDDPLIKRVLVSRAQRDVASRVDWPELRVEGTFTVTDDPPFVLPASENFLRISWVYIDGMSDVLLPKQRKELLQFERQDAVDQPSYFAVDSDGLGSLQLWLAPKPRANAVIRYAYVRKPDPVLNGTDALLVPDHLIEAVQSRTSYLIWTRKGDLERAAFFKAQYEDELRFLMDEVLTQRGPGVPKTRQDW